MFNQITGGGYGFPGGNGFQQGGFGRGLGGPRRGRGRRGRHGLGAKIRQGIQNGSISQSDAQNLRAKRQEMRQLRQSVMADGQVTPQERAQLRSYRQQMHEMLSQFSQG